MENVLTSTTCIRNAACIIAWDAANRRHAYLIGGDVAFTGETLSFVGKHYDGTADETIDGGLEYPQYTRPPEFRGWRDPDILLSGNHVEIARWRRRQRLIRTARRRPDLLEQACITVE